MRLDVATGHALRRGRVLCPPAWGPTEYRQKYRLRVFKNRWTTYNSGHIVLLSSICQLATQNRPPRRRKWPETRIWKSADFRPGFGLYGTFLVRWA